ncbi:tripartite motif-containing protein 16-like isoform X2 [Dreissena polymorpha]|uniref:tripartite motif-containing protein 16-like isoform X2 n=1 Tax=Dreissena polymorpha TaxID=45954 RepID=UPI002264236E|nr:tripartite motif-containing protein 16-like isoform X2 [Dreissena polymorpha]
MATADFQESDMNDAEYDFVCQNCASEGLNVEAEYFCKDCAKYVCTNHKNNVHAGHMIPRKSENELAKCYLHNSEFIMFCQTHQELCCDKCLEQNHRSCSDLEFLFVMIAKDKITNENVIKQQAEAKITLEELSKYRKPYNMQKDRIEESAKTAITEIKVFRRNIDTVLDALEKESIDSVNSLKDELTIELQQNINHLLALQGELYNTMTTLIPHSRHELLEYIRFNKVRDIVRKSYSHITDVMTKPANEIEFKENTIQYLEVLNTKIQTLGTIKLEEPCSGIAYHADNLYVASKTVLNMYNTSGYRVKKLYEDNVTPGSVNLCKVNNKGTLIYITGIGQSQIMQLDWSDGQAKPLKQVSLTDPRGLCITEIGNVLVCDRGSNSIMLVNGTNISTLIGSTDCPNMPVAVCYTRTNPCLIIGSSSRNSIRVIRLNEVI